MGVVIPTRLSSLREARKTRRAHSSVPSLRTASAASRAACARSSCWLSTTSATRYASPILGPKTRSTYASSVPSLASSAESASSKFESHPWPTSSWKPRMKWVAIS